MRRKNRQVKMTLDIPEECETEENFMQTLMAEMDKTDWSINMFQVDDDGEELEQDELVVPVSKLTLGDIEIEPEEEDE